MYSGLLFGCLLCFCAVDTSAKQTRREAGKREADEAIAVDASAKQTFLVWRDWRDTQLPSDDVRPPVLVEAMAGALPPETHVFVPSMNRLPTSGSSAGAGAQPPGTHVFVPGRDSMPTSGSSASAGGARAQPPEKHVFVPGMDSVPAHSDARAAAPGAKPSGATPSGGSPPGAMPGTLPGAPLTHVFVPNQDSVPADVRKNAPERGSAHWLCKDMAAEFTGFEVHTDEGFLGHASCQDLANKCHNWKNSSKVQEVCPISCFICDPVKSHIEPPEPPCYDSITTGVRFKNGPEAKCTDLARYCNHSTLYLHVQAACRLACGLCEAHVGHVGGGECRDLETNDHPQYVIAGSAASCYDLTDFCSNGDESYLIRHKCPRTCGACPEQIAADASAARLESVLNSAVENALHADPHDSDYHADVENSDCDRRRRWGFCSTRRRRNL